MLDHILSNWKTSAAGLLLAVATIAGVLSQQGVTLGTAGTGTVVALIAAIATALLGLIARDPGAAAELTKRSGPQKLGALLLCLMLWPVLMPAAGCTISQAQIVADGNALSAALTSTAKVLAQSDPATAQRLLTAASAISAVTANWQGTNSIALLNAAASGAEVVLSAIPQTSIVAALLPIAVAALDVVLANTAPAGTSAALRLTEAQMANLDAYRARSAGAIHHRVFRSPAGDFKAAWDAKARAIHLAQAQI